MLYRKSSDDVIKQRFNWITYLLREHGFTMYLNKIRSEIIGSNRDTERCLHTRGYLSHNNDYLPLTLKKMKVFYGLYVGTHCLLSVMLIAELIVKDYRLHKRKEKHRNQQRRNQKRRGNKQN